MLASTACATGKEKGFENHPKMLPKSSPRAPKSLPRAPKEAPRSSTELPRSSTQRPRSPQISQQSPSRSQGLSKVRPKGLQGTLWEAFWDDLGLKIEVSEPMLTHSLSELSSSSCKPGRYFRSSLRLLPFSRHSSHSSHCINPLRRFAQSSEISSGSNVVFEGARERERESEFGGRKKQRERERERNEVGENSLLARLKQHESSPACCFSTLFVVLPNLLRS